MNKWDLVRAWGRILSGRRPSLSIEITKECPLRCPGCYAYEPEHLGDAGPLRSLADLSGQRLIDGVLGLVEEHQPIHVSIVGGEPLVRFRELDVILPELSRRGVAVQVVTSAVRPIPQSWKGLPELSLSVSIDGLQPEHDVRRAPATYDRILKHVEGHSITVHCTVTTKMASRPESFQEFLSFWSARPEARRIWFSLFTPQVGAQGEEILSQSARVSVMEELRRLRSSFPKMYMTDRVIEAFLKPPASPAGCVFARTTTCVSADLRSPVTPCQLGGQPDCSQCGCFAAAGLTAMSQYRLAGFIPLRAMLDASQQVGKVSSWVAELHDPSGAVVPAMGAPRRAEEA